MTLNSKNKNRQKNPEKRKSRFSKEKAEDANVNRY